MSVETSPAIASIRVGERGRMNLPVQLRTLADIHQGDLLVVTRVSDGEIVIKTPAGIRDFIHSGVVTTAQDDDVAQARRGETSDQALERRLAAPHDPEAGSALLDALGL